MHPLPQQTSPQRNGRARNQPIPHPSCHREKISASTQNQALSAILFLYRHVLHIELDEASLSEFRPQRAKTVPTVMSKDEVKRVFENMTGIYKLIAQVMYGLPLIGSGDWNDGFNRVGSQGKGESTWLTWFLIDVLKRFAEVCDQRDLLEEAEAYREQANAYIKAVEEYAWDGDWYLRAYYDDGTALGSHRSEECQIDAIAQSWSVLSGAGDRKRSESSMNVVWERLTDTNNNLSLLFSPPFDKTSDNPGYIKDYPPGVRENGGQYTHAAAWTAWAYAGLGDSARAWHLFDILNPIYQADSEKRATQYRVEPYISAADVYSQGSQLRRGGWTWYTGSAGWLYRLGIEQLLGLHRENNILHLNPIIPARWDGFKMQYRYLDTEYRIQVWNPEHVSHNVREIRFDGNVVDGKNIFLPNDGFSHGIEIMMGI